MNGLTPLDIWIDISYKDRMKRVLLKLDLVFISEYVATLDIGSYSREDLERLYLGVFK